MRIYLFRHGETDWNKERRLQGRRDIPLNEHGRELAVKTARALGDIPFDRAFCSPLERARETARILLGDAQVPLEADDRLMEVAFGEYEGAGFDEAKRNPAHPLYDFYCHPERYVPPEGGESLQEVQRRGWQFLQERIFPLEGICGNVLIVAHGAFNRGILNGVLGIPLERFWEIALPNCAASILSLEDGKLGETEAGKVYYGTPVNGSP